MSTIKITRIADSSASSGFCMPSCAMGAPPPAPAFFALGQWDVPFYGTDLERGQRRRLVRCDAVRHYPPRLEGLRPYGRTTNCPTGVWHERQGNRNRRMPDGTCRRPRRTSRRIDYRESARRIRTRTASQRSVHSGPLPAGHGRWGHLPQSCRDHDASGRGGPAAQETGNRVRR